MKRFLYATCGALGSVILSYLIVNAFSYWYGPRYIKSDSDINTVFLWSLIFMAFCLVLGAIFGYRQGRPRKV
ncbi:hypothetical protein [Paracidovorax valerianellae]|uniref:Uncharacterized protein n=1 Tax=Paracidovorax valerianellae TaxID=187868 RepID=A0A1G7EA77_9BURK|nr:hypothetical protein [Paracidovorax valerianellae]MDA8447421.1 hypothetical protein [Paracidovorax valerianellae]SDE60356.1 hypothetical protein SAMN05192589_12234 [Paracidovorax valerianellae]